ncbi:MAG: aldo/keto reductase [Planctomycetes bacterium]|nr:aldo/keto reductase [Planctomycetota bacterium]
MKYGEVPGIRKRVSRLVLGTMVLGEWQQDAGFELLDNAFELGINTFDTGHVYGELTESRLGAWFNDRGVRDEVVILGKGAHYDDFGPRVNPRAIRQDLEESLDRQGADYMDLYMLHRDDPSVDVGALVDVLNELRDEGLISAFGASNWTCERIRAANSYAEAHNLTPFAASSPNFTLARPFAPLWEGCLSIGGPEGLQSREWYRRARMPVFAWSSLGRGFFSGRLTPENFEEIKDTLDPACVRAFCHEENFRRLDRARRLAAEKALSVPQVALAYVLSQRLSIFAIVGCRNRREIEQDIETLDLELSPEEQAWLDLRAE